MQNAVPNGQGGMIAILGLPIDELTYLLNSKNNLQCYIANDNSIGQIVISGKIDSLEIL